MKSINRVDPPSSASEKELLAAFLNYHRATLLMKIDGVSDEDLRRPMVRSGTNLLGLVKHLAWVERGWFGEHFANEKVDYPFSDDDPDADFRVEPDETTESIIELYLDACEHSRAIVDACESLDELGRGPYRREPRSMRWIMLHMIEETARHNGHADILREQIDGATGE